MSAPGPRIAVVAATYNRCDRLARLLSGLRAQTLSSGDFEVIIVNDASPDGTRELLDAAVAAGDLSLTAIHQEVNAGRSQAREDGWRAASAPLVAFTDDDCVPAPDWLEEALTACAEQPGAIVQGFTEPEPSELDRLGPFSRTISVPHQDAAYQTCNIVYPRELLERVGGFDVAAFGRVHGGEDSDLAWRAIKEQGARAVFSERMRVRHAVNQLGPADKLRFAAGWSMLAYARHPELREAHFANRFFWKPSHVWLARAVTALATLLFGPRWLKWPIAAWLAFPYVRSVRARGIEEGGGLPMAPYYVAYDLAETRAAVGESIRHRTPML